jgi:phospholipase/carboxylesterase
LAIHGRGDRPEDFAPLLTELEAPARLIVPRAPTPFSDGFTWFPLDGGLQGAETDRGVRAAARGLADALAAITKTRPTRGRPIVTGFSQGGALSFALALLHPDSVSAAFPVGGWVAFPLPSEAATSGAGRPPIVALHGGDDRLIPAAGTRDAVSRLQKLGYTAELREHSGVGHTIPAAMRRELLGLIAGAVRGR